MRKYRLEFTKSAKKHLAKLDKPTQALIVKWLEQNLQDTTKPRAQGKALTGQFSHLWRYRVGNYRILAEIHDNTITIEVVKIGHRKEIYK
ncbi:type II toxin-antitoxin system RelE family toxin [Streptococcus suis]|uniref:type II toxin-antitoxin system RelE family toxin n=1 Tax=Streptococcus suis TaxID=1307 RepID=UPI001C9848FC|nr:type II toxin-antitoxin system RelE/ParE family toxin [Streptococcus suis]MBY5023941.1 type II toxin-antitoxin system RelE/ParE family toxin [Streptococcus suis]